MIRHPKGFRRARAALAEFGLLMLADSVLPSVATIVAGEPVRGSWWGHARGMDIFRVATALGHDSDVLGIKLVKGKVTFVWRSLWPASLSVARSGEAWQTRALSPAARTLHKHVKNAGRVSLDELRERRLKTELGVAARELEVRLLVYAESAHTESGKHAKCLESWDHWLDRVNYEPAPLASDAARAELEQAVQKLAAGKAIPALPWNIRG
jgi:hypothetical protein